MVCTKPMSYRKDTIQQLLRHSTLEQKLSKKKRHCSTIACHAKQGATRMHVTASTQPRQAKKTMDRSLPARALSIPMGTSSLSPRQRETSWCMQQLTWSSAGEGRKGCLLSISIEESSTTPAYWIKLGCRSQDCWIHHTSSISIRQHPQLFVPSHLKVYPQHYQVEDNLQ